MNLNQTVRQTAKRMIRGVYWAWTRRLEGVAIHQNRSDYKATWQQLSRTEADAKMFVASEIDEAQLATSAVYTLATIDRLVGVHPGDTVLEIGCGVGRVGQAMAPRCARWIGTDIAANMVRHTTNRLKHLPNVSAVELPDASLAPIENASVDLVYCTVVFMHLYEWDRFRYVSEAFRVLRPGGRCYVDNIDLTSSKGWEVFQDSNAYRADERPAYLAMTSTADELRTYGERAGFNDVRTHRWDDAWVAMTGVKP